MAKKSFKHALETEGNPAAAFLTQPATTAPEPEAAQPMETGGGRGRWTHRDAYHIGDEAKSRRVNILLKPSVHEAAKIAANREGLSFNALVNHLLEDYLEREGQR